MERAVRHCVASAQDTADYRYRKPIVYSRPGAAAFVMAMMPLEIPKPYALRLPYGYLTVTWGCAIQARQVVNSGEYIMLYLRLSVSAAVITMLPACANGMESLISCPLPPHSERLH